jgi:hypothetical protein
MESNNQISTISIVLDTNIIFCKNFADFINPDVTKIKDIFMSDKSIQLVWFIPEIAMRERHYQILQALLENKKWAHNFTRIFDLEVDLSKESLEYRVQKIQEEAVRRNGIRIQKLNIVETDWNGVIYDSINRNPPFRKSDKEEGFRDSLILQTFLQILKESKDSKKVFFITDDELLMRALKERIDNPKVDLSCYSLLILEGRLKEIQLPDPEQNVLEKVRALVEILFIRPDSKEGFYYSEKIEEKIFAKYHSEFSKLPESAEYREIGLRQINPPQYLKKENDRYFWNSRINIEIKYFQTQHLSNNFIIIPTVSGSPVHSGGSIVINPSSDSISTGSYVYRENYLGEVGIVPNFTPTSDNPYSVFSNVMTSSRIINIDVEWTVKVNEGNQPIEPELIDIEIVT